MTFVQGIEWHTRRKASYEHGDLWCAQCRVWILRENRDRLTHPNKKGYALHHNECGYKMRTRSRQSKTEAIRKKRIARREENSIRLPSGNRWTGQSGIAQDLFKDLPKWEMLVKQHNNNNNNNNKK